MIEASGGNRPLFLSIARRMTLIEEMVVVVVWTIATCLVLNVAYNLQEKTPIYLR